MKELTLGQMETTQGGKFWGTVCDQSLSADGCWEYSTNCRKYMFWFEIGEPYDNSPVFIGGPNC